MSNPESADAGPNAGVLQDDRRGAILSDDREYRYSLWRKWDVEKPMLAWIMLNPSTADETEDDPTIRRCIGYAKDWGYGGVVVGNVFGLRTPDPGELAEHPNPIGPENDTVLRRIARDSDRVMVAWGASYDTGLGAVRRTYTPHLLLEEVDELWALDTTKDGHPVHPLYQPADAEPERWSP